MAIDENTPLPRVTIGFFVGMLALVIAGTQFKTRMDDVADRQAKYIERRNQEHATMEAEMNRLEEELHEYEDRFERLCQEIAARWHAAVCD